MALVALDAALAVHTRVVRVRVVTFEAIHFVDIVARSVGQLFGVEALVAIDAEELAVLGGVEGGFVNRKRHVFAVPLDRHLLVGVTHQTVVVGRLREKRRGGYAKKGKGG